MNVNTIVFPTDFSATSLSSLNWAKQIAQNFDAELHCVFVVQEPTFPGPIEMGTIPIPPLQELVDNAESHLLKFVGEHFEEADGKIVASVVVGRPSTQIVSYAQQKQPAMIVMSTHGYTGIKHAIIGSTAEAVLRHSDCPVLTIPAA